MWATAVDARTRLARCNTDPVAGLNQETGEAGAAVDNRRIAIRQLPGPRLIGPGVGLRARETSASGSRNGPTTSPASPPGSEAVVVFFLEALADAGRLELLPVDRAALAAGGAGAVHDHRGGPG
jgi:hypothetical protein